MALVSGDLRNCRNQIVMVDPGNRRVLEGEVVCVNIFNRRSFLADQSELSELDPNVAAFTSLVLHAPQMTHDEIKGQIDKLLRV